LLEIFAKLPKKSGVDSSGEFNPMLYLEKSSDWEYICRLQSRLLRLGYPLSKIIDDAEKSAFTMFSLPALMKRILCQYQGELTDEEKEDIFENKSGQKCPDCGEYTLVNESGCNKCLSCGYSKCG
jgi:hypothetical protein